MPGGTTDDNGVSSTVSLNGLQIKLCRYFCEQKGLSSSDALNKLELKLPNTLL